MTPGPALVDPAAWFAQRLVIIAPHADDETLGCGALIARLSATHEIHVVFATDGSRSPRAPHNSDRDRPSLAAVREQEAIAALGLLGVPGHRLHFLRFPDGQLRERLPALQAALRRELAAVPGADVLVPFRYDWHADHIAVHRAAAAALRDGGIEGRLIEYFVYTQRRLLPKGDIRAYLRSPHAVSVGVDQVANLKQRALECFQSQTTLYFAWQRRPILTSELLQRMCADPESFVLYEPSARRVVRRSGWIHIANVMEPPLKRVKDEVLGWLRG